MNRFTIITTLLVVAMISFFVIESANFNVLEHKSMTLDSKETEAVLKNNDEVEKEIKSKITEDKKKLAVKEDSTVAVSIVPVYKGLAYENGVNEDKIIDMKEPKDLPQGLLDQLIGKKIGEHLSIKAKYDSVATSSATTDESTTDTPEDAIMNKKFTFDIVVKDIK